MMAKNNLGRNKKKVTIVTLSFALSIVLLNSVYTYVTSFDFDKFVADFSLTGFYCFRYYDYQQLQPI